jgi:8-oxo-dGTP pyrophosphatase MutT (NUDIX family)
MMKKFDTIDSASIIKNPYWEYRLDKYILPNGNEGEYHFVRTNGSTFILPFISDTELLLTRQYRYLNRRHSIEFPGGGIKQGLSPLVNAIEELEEETGYSANYMEYIGSYNPFNGVTDEYCHVFIADNLYKVDTLPEPCEEIEIIKLDISRIRELISKGEIWDGMTLAAFSILQNRK